MRSFAAKLARFVNPAPQDVDPEDETIDNSSDSGSDNEEARAHYLEVGKSALRQDEPEVDSKTYSAARASRRDLDSEESESESESEDEDQEEEAEEQDDTPNRKRSNSISSKRPDSIEPPSAISAVLQEEQRQILSRLAQNTNQDAAKGKAVAASNKIYENLLDARISLQKVVVASHGDVEDPEPALDALCDLISQIHTLRNKLQGTSKHKHTKKRTFEDLAESTFEMDQQLAKRRDTVLSKWSRKVQLASGSTAMQGSSFKSLNQSAARQVEGVLGDMDRLVKRTQINRSQYKVNGEIPDHSDEIFDDTDFYRLLLTELVERRMAENSADGDNLKWKVAKASKNKLKKARDTSASKGRRLRYDVQDKLVSFDAPRPNVYAWTDEQADELFASLLGVTITMDDEEPTEEVVEEFNLFG